MVWFLMLAMRKCSLQLTAARCPSTFGYSAMSARFSHRVQERRLICHHWSICHHLETFSETGIVLKLLSSNVLICNVLHQKLYLTQNPQFCRGILMVKPLGAESRLCGEWVSLLIRFVHNDHEFAWQHYVPLLIGKTAPRSELQREG